PQPEVETPTTAPDAAKPATTAKLIRKLAPAVRAEPPAGVTGAPTTPIESVVEVEDTNGSLAESAAPETEAAPPLAAAPAEGTPAPPSRQVRVLRPTAAALNAGVRPGERAPSPVIPPPVTPRDRAERGTRLRERTPLAKTERLGTPGETATPQTTYIPPPDAGRRRSRRTPTRG